MKEEHQPSKHSERRSRKNRRRGRSGRRQRQDQRRNDHPWQRVVSVMQTHFHEPDVQGARAVYAAVAAHQLEGQPVWPMIVAPPGSGKTETLDPLQGLEGVHFIDSVTPNTFISGQIQEDKSGGRASSLLERVGRSAIFVYADFSTVLGMPSDRRASILADMRRIFDGRLRKEFGTSESVRQWEGRVTFVVAATPDVDQHYAIFQSLGERFLMIRWHRPNGPKAAIRAMNQDMQRAKADMCSAVHALFHALHSQEVSITGEDQQRLASLAEFAVRARTHVARDHRKVIIYTPEPEGPTRLAQQLCQLAKGSARLLGRTTVEAEDMDLVRRVAFDCIPVVRRKILDDCIDTKLGAQPGKLSIPATTLSYARADLASVGLLEDKGKSLSLLARDLLVQAGILGPLHQTSPPNEGEEREESTDTGVGVASSEAAREAFRVRASPVAAANKKRGRIRGQRPGARRGRTGTSSRRRPTHE